MDGIYIPEQFIAKSYLCNKTKSNKSIEINQKTHLTGCYQKKMQDLISATSTTTSGIQTFFLPPAGLECETPSWILQRAQNKS